MNRALVLLSGRALSVSELKEKLRRRAAQPSDIDDVILKLKDAGYLNDGRLAETFAAARIENQAFGRMRVLRDLRGRRVAPAVAEKAVADAFREVDALLTPTSPIPAFKLGAKADPLAMYLCDIYTIGVNLAGLPAISVPCGFTSEHLPIGLQLIGRPFEESSLLAIAHTYERAHEWSTQHPNL